MNLLFLNPPTLKGEPYVKIGRCVQKVKLWSSLWPPIPLAQSLSVVKPHFNASLIDAVALKTPIQDILNHIIKDKVSLVVLNASTPTIEDDTEVAKIIKIKTNAKVALTGVHTTVCDEKPLLRGQTDFILRAEPETASLSLAEHLSGKRRIEDVPNLSFLSEGAIKRNPIRFIENLDELPFPDRGSLPNHLYRMPLFSSVFTILITGRGCPKTCTFCLAPIFYGRRVRLRSPENVVDEIEEVLTRYGIDCFLFWADTFTMVEEQVMGICSEILRRGLKIMWSCNSRTDTVNLKMMKEMKRAGCFLISFGIESGNQRILDEIQKGTTPHQAVKAVTSAKEAGLMTMGHFLIGTPSDSKETVMETLALALRLPLDFCQFYCPVPYPGTPLYILAKREGLLESEDYREYHYENPVMRTKYLSRNEIKRLRLLSYMKFYGRHRIVMNSLSIAKKRFSFPLMDFVRFITSWFV